MNEFGLRGAALWALDNEHEDFWNWYEKGFNTNEYESEQEAKERSYYEYVEMLISNVEPLRLSGEIEMDNTEVKFKEEKKQGFRKINFVHIETEKVQMPLLQENDEKVVIVNEHSRKAEKISNYRQIKRLEKK